MNKALQLEPNNTDVLLGTGSVASTLGQLDRSIELLEHAVTLDSLGLEGLGSLGRRYVTRGRYDEALEIYRRILVLFPDNAWTSESIAETYLRQGNPEHALANILIFDAFRHLEDDARYPVFLEKLGLLEAWKAMPRD